MADQSLSQEDCLDDSDEGVYEQGDGPTAGEIEDESLTPFQRVAKYACSENAYNRQYVSGVLLELFQMATPEALTADLPQIMEIFGKIVNQDDIMVRMDALEHIPNLAAMALKQSQKVPALANITSEYLLSMVVNNLGDNENQVRKNAQKSLFTLLEQGLVSKAQAEIQVCPTILALSRKDTMSTDGVTLMAKIIPLLGRDVTERVFLDRFAELCSDSKFYVRKSCASHIGDFCAVISGPLFEKVLFVAYTKLCNDEVWGVRKACADVAMSVSCACSPELRKTVLAPAFAKLLGDKCRWVKISAFQTLGPFITTFAEPTITSLAYNNMGELVLVSYGSEFRINNSTTPMDEVKNLFYLCMDDFRESIDYSNYCDDVDKKPDEGDDKSDEQWSTDNKEPELNISFAGLPETAGSCSNTEEKVLEVEDIGSILHSDAPVITTDDDDDAEDENGRSGNESNINVIEGSDKKCDNLSSEISTISSQLTNVSITAASTSSAVDDNVTDNLESVELSTPIEQTNKSIESNSADSGGTPPAEGNIEEDLELYNSYNYWYVPPDMPLDPNIVVGAVANISASASEAEDIKNVEPNTDAFCESGFESREVNETFVLPSVADATFNIQEHPDDFANNSESSSEDTEEKEPPQKIVPQLLIDHFISMADPNVAQNISDNIAYHCAYSLPAVALTLGSSNSHLLKPTVETLAANMQYRVRHTLASSLHELALIWGPDIASNDLTPIFNDFIKDLDEVRIGVLKNLAHFLGLIHPTKRSLYLPRLSFFLQNNQKLNWRYRHELAEQLMLSVTMFTPAEASKHITHIAHRLLCDKVAAVRQITLQLVSQLLRHISSEPGLRSRLLIKYAETFAHSKKWKHRQTFVLLCSELLVSQALPIEQFACDVMPHLLDLGWDPVANVRLAVARTVTSNMINNDYFHDQENQHYDTLDSVLRRLQTDKDADVRQAATPEVCPKTI